MAYLTYHYYRFIENIPSATSIASIPLGSLVELTATITDEYTYPSPNGTECATYRAHIFQGSSRRQTLVPHHNNPELFAVEDGNGDTLLVDPQHAQIAASNDQLQCFAPGEYPEYLTAAVKEHGNDPEGRLCVEQVSLHPGEDVYMLGRVDTRTVNGKQRRVLQYDDEYDLFLLSTSPENTFTDNLQSFLQFHLTVAFLATAWLLYILI